MEKSDSPHFGQLFLGNLFFCDSLLFVCALHIASHWSKVAKFLYPICILFSAPAGGDSVGISRSCLITLILVKIE